MPERELSDAEHVVRVYNGTSMSAHLLVLPDGAGSRAQVPKQGRIEKWNQSQEQCKQMIDVTELTIITRYIC